jgi:8-oxo-dGTP pyrophosphatase MutT (NUDIX family)
MAPSTSSEGTFESRQVVTAFLEHDGKILIVRRSQAVGTHRGRWSGISGYLEREPLDQALVEIEEETGLGEGDVELVSSGQVLEIDDAEHKVCWRVHPFLFHVKHPEAVQLDWENLELRWITPADIDDYDTVPALKETLARCLMNKPQ